MPHLVKTFNLLLKAVPCTWTLRPLLAEISPLNKFFTEQVYSSSLLAFKRTKSPLGNIKCWESRKKIRDGRENSICIIILHVMQIFFLVLVLITTSRQNSYESLQITHQIVSGRSKKMLIRVESVKQILFSFGR